jgi:hypothetical protein
MNWNLALSALIELVDLGLRFSSKPEDIEKYIELRRQLLEEQVRIANLGPDEAQEALDVDDNQLELPFDGDSDESEEPTDAASSAPHSE